MKTTFKLLTLSLLLMITVTSCADNEDDEISTQKLCEDMKILKVLKDEPARVMIAGDGSRGYLCLINFMDYQHVFSGTLLPVGGLPEQYMEEDLAVYISGNVTNCDTDSYNTRTRYARFNLFELKSIKKR